MSINPLFLGRPIYTIINALVVPVDLEGSADNVAVLQFIFPIYIFLDTIVEDIYNGSNPSISQSVNMSINALFLGRPVYTIINALVVPVDLEGSADNVAILQFIFPIYIFLDTIVEDIYNGRSLGDEQAMVYNGLAARLTGQYGLDGKACVQRFVCELQRRHIAGWSVVGNILTHIFTPHTGGNKRDIDLLRDYLTAKSLGNKEDNVCGLHYQSCPFSVFNYFDARKNITNSLPFKTPN
ncbi:hypothetical protein Pcinc_020867 [Petrolisthes cinctipes]|uniref:Uncharacterized protein n=1 Tax=Petrolisthes cinctipes TaxID=88211 RepID=A0AAE1KIG9_PETCI|nr:hypothetical protein Pcinc_020867 [Petrolisthes cinctipes]